MKLKWEWDDSGTEFWASVFKERERKKNRCVKTSEKVSGNKTNENKYLKQKITSLFIDKICKKKKKAYSTFGIYKYKCLLKI